VAPRSGDSAGQALEQLGVKSAQGQSGQKSSLPQVSAVEKMKQKAVQEEKKTKQEIVKLKKELEEEIKKLRLQREAEMRQRRQAAKQAEPPAGKSALGGIPTPKGKQPKGLLAGLRARKQKSHAELAGQRRSG
jgi:hypothetical protein